MLPPYLKRSELLSIIFSPSWVSPAPHVLKIIPIPVPFQRHFTLVISFPPFHPLFPGFSWEVLTRKRVHPATPARRHPPAVTKMQVDSLLLYPPARAPHSARKPTATFSHPTHLWLKMHEEASVGHAERGLPCHSVSDALRTPMRFTS